MSAPAAFTIISVNTSAAKGTGKQPQPQITLDAQGVVGDAHYGQGFREVSLLAEESIARLAQTAGRAFAPGAFAENLTTHGGALTALALLDRLAAGTLELEVTALGKACHGAGCAIFREVGECVMPREGVFCRVVRGGILRPGDRLEHRPRRLRAWVLTLSDRASRGVYADRSGPAIAERLAAFGAERGWALEIQRRLLPDEPALLQQALAEAAAAEADLIVTTGGTGLGPRDRTPEVVTSFCERLVPGVMERVRQQCAERLPSALLSRAVMGVRGPTLVYALPGSVGAVRDYLAEILRTLEHAVYMLHGAEAHAEAGAPAAQ